MNIPEDASIPIEKLTCYLLVPKLKDDKSKFLAQAGFTQDNPDSLLTAVQQLIQQNSAILDSTNEYGTFYLVEGLLQGENGQQLAVITVWLQSALDSSFRFITLKPRRN